MATQQIKVKEVAYHRNGISGEGFHVVLFTWHDTDDRPHKVRNMQAILFDESGQCAVLDTDEVAKGNIGFAQGNSWRGDNFEPELRRAITGYWESRREVV